VLQGGVGIEWHLRDSDSARPSRQASNRNYNGQTGAVQGYEAAREAALAAFAKRAKPLELLPAALLHWSKRRGRALIPPIESAAHELSMQLPTQRYNDANPPLLWRCCSHYL
jgi:hypothetical protein